MPSQRYIMDPEGDTFDANKLCKIGIGLVSTDGKVMDTEKFIATISEKVKTVSQEELGVNWIVFMKIIYEIFDDLGEEELNELSESPFHTLSFTCGRMLGRFEKNTDCRVLLVDEPVSEDDKKFIKEIVDQAKEREESDER